MQCCTCSKWAHLKCPQLSFSRFKTLKNFYSWSCPPALCGNPTPTNTVTSSSDSSSLYTPIVQYVTTSAALPPTLAFKALIPLPYTLYLIPLQPHHPLPFQAVSLLSSVSSCPLTPSGFFNGILGISEAGALKFYTLFRPTPQP